MSVFFEILRNNLWGYDSFIFVIAIANAIVLFISWLGVRKVQKELRGAPDRSLVKGAHKIDEVGYEEALELKVTCESINKTFSFFTSFISIFPYIGILGTVVAMIGTAGDGGFDAMQKSFLVALTSTFWGVGFAVLFKLIGDAPLSPRIEQINADIDRVIAKYDSKEIDGLED